MTEKHVFPLLRFQHHTASGRSWACGQCHGPGDLCLSLCGEDGGWGLSPGLCPWGCLQKPGQLTTCSRISPLPSSPCLFPSAAPRHTDLGRELRKWVSWDARTRGCVLSAPRWMGVCSGSTQSPSSLPFSLRSCCSGPLSPKLGGFHFLPAVHPVSGALGCPCRGADWLYRSAFFRLGRPEQSPSPSTRTLLLRPRSA